MSNYTFYASVNTTIANVTLNTGGITGNYVVVNGTPVTSIAFQALLDLIASSSNISLIQDTVFRNGVYNITLTSTPVLMYIVTLGSTSSANVGLYNAENQLISNQSNLYGELGRPLHFYFNPIDNGVNSLTNLQTTVNITNASGSVIFNEDHNVTVDTFNTSDFILTDYSVHNYTITLYDNESGLSRTYTGQMQATNILPTITSLSALRANQPDTCIVGQTCSVQLIVNDDGCNVAGQSGFATFVSANTSLLSNSTTWTYTGETSKNFCKFISQEWIPQYVDVVNVTANYSDILSYTSQVNGTMNIGTAAIPTTGGGAVYEALPGIVQSLNQTTQFYNTYGQSVNTPNALQAIVERIGDFFSYTVFTYTTQHCLQFAQSDKQYCENYQMNKIRVWHVMLIMFAIIILLSVATRIILDYKRLYKYDKEHEKKKR